uniref:Craniofacial development protein 2-like n=1 Tax=Nicotiana tabacum TaxID=4097 RepID=A0A1S4CMA6_TOBAC
MWIVSNFGILGGWDRNGAGILVDKDLRELVVEVRRVNDRLMTIKLVVGGVTLNKISVYAPQAGLDKEVKRRFWEDLDEMVCVIPHIEKLFIGADFNGHIGATSEGYDDVDGGFGFGDRNGRGMSLLDFARAFDLVIANSSFPKKSDRGLCTDCKVILSENLSTLLRLLVMGLEITRKRRKRAMYSQHRIKWEALMEAKAQELRVKLVTMGSWMSSGDASAMWTMTALCIREAAREKKATLAVTTAKIATFSRLYEELESRGGDKRLFRQIRVDEVDGAMRKMNRGKATGPDEIPVEFWKS